MNEKTGWLIDVYPDPQGGIKLWLLCDTGERLCLRQPFSVTFYIAGNFALLRKAWMFLRDKAVDLTRTRRLDLFSGEREVLAVKVRQPVALPKLFRAVSSTFPMLDYYDADIPLPLRYAGQTGVSLSNRCRVRLDEEVVQSIVALDSPWELDPPTIPLRILYLSPEVDPARHPPGKLRVRYERVDYCLSLTPARALIIALRAVLDRFDPDLIISDFGDTWLFPQLRLWNERFNPNRDQKIPVLTRQANSYFAYGQVIYRGAQTHLFGRWHIDRRNAMLFNEYGLEGVLEQARVTGLGVQEMARKSPGAGITAMQMQTALRRGVLVPVQKQQAEGRKSLDELIRADRGGMIYQPIIGLHRNVAQIDFASMFPAIMVNWNISPETVCNSTDFGLEQPEGLVPATLRPLVEKRLALKRKLIELDPRDCRVKTIKSRVAALKWLLVVCFGYLGYKNARFGRIESHEAVTALSRELLLQAKEAAEALDFTVLHMYVDSLFVLKEGLHCSQDFTPLLEAINAKTGLAIALDGVYKWVVFLPSKRNARVPVPNRYFGVFHGGEIKARGIALRRHDTCRFVGETQMGILRILAQADDPVEKLGEAREYLQKQIRELREGRVPLEDLVMAQRLSRAVEAYRVPSPAAQAARQLQAQQVAVHPGMRICFWFVHGGVKIGEVQVPEIDIKKYRRQLELAADEVLTIFGGRNVMAWELAPVLLQAKLPGVIVQS